VSLRGRTRIALIFLTFLAAACSAAPSPTPSPAAASGAPATPDLATARSVLQAADLSKPATIAAVDRVRFTAVGEQAARELLAAGASGEALWAATWVYASSGKDPAPLRGLVTSQDATIRVMAAAFLVATGERAGFEPLVNELADEDLLAGSVPPQAVWTFAVSTLVRYAGPNGPVPPVDAPAAELAAAQAAWSGWLSGQGGKLRFDPATGTWSSS